MEFSIRTKWAAFIHIDKRINLDLVSRSRCIHQSSMMRFRGHHVEDRWKLSEGFLFSKRVWRYQCETSFDAGRWEKENYLINVDSLQKLVSDVRKEFEISEIYSTCHPMLLFFLFRYVTDI